MFGKLRRTHFGGGTAHDHLFPDWRPVDTLSAETLALTYTCALGTALHSPESSAPAQAERHFAGEVAGFLAARGIADIQALPPKDLTVIRLFFAACFSKSAAYLSAVESLANPAMQGRLAALRSCAVRDMKAAIAEQDRDIRDRIKAENEPPLKVQIEREIDKRIREQLMSD